MKKQQKKYMEVINFHMYWGKEYFMRLLWVERVCVMLEPLSLSLLFFYSAFIVIFKRQMSRRNPDIFYESQAEAEESQEHVDDDSALPQSEEEGQDLIEHAERDYEKIDELDRYEDQGVDAENVDLNPEARRKAEKELNLRDRINDGEQMDDYIDYDMDEQAELVRRKRFYQNQQQDQQINERRYIDAEQCKGKLHLWIQEEDTKRYIKRRFQRFLKDFTEENSSFRIYYSKMQDMLHENKTSLDIKYQHFKRALPTLTMWLGLEPSYLIPELNSILHATLCRMSPQFKNIVKETYVKVFELPINDRIPDLRSEHLNKLVKVRGVVTARSEIFSQLKKAIYKCIKCGEKKGPYFLHDRESVVHGSCRSCQSPGPFILERMSSVYRNFQRLTIQESPSEVMPGRIPRTKEVILTGDNVDITKPGEDIEVTGIYILRYQLSINLSQGFPVFFAYIEANAVKKYNDISVFSVHEENQFAQFAKRPDVDELICNSIAPSIFGHDEVKQALAFSLFGGNQKYLKEKAHRIRGDINILLLGDPGVSKSQFLKSLQKIAPRSVYATGKGASAVGLTATVKQDSQTGEWRLEAGAMVLADKGLCLIDEFDKMNEHDRTSIHEAMEQQTISISKAGIVAQLRARCSVIAAANPLQGQYNQQLNFADNVNLSDPILSRFDIVKIIKDRPNEQLDYDLSTFLISSHMTSHPYNQLYQQQIETLAGKQKAFEVMDQEFLKQYIKYAKQKFQKVTINEKCSQMIKEIYLKLRESSVTSGGINITPRHLESAIRICEAHAKMHLRQQTIREDAQIAIRTMMKSFIETQKHGTAQKLTREFKFYLSRE